MESEELRKLLDKAMPGPWEWINEPSSRGGPWRLGPGIMWPDNSDGTPGGDRIDRANARLIAAAPDLASELLDLRAEVDRLSKAATAVVCLDANAMSEHECSALLREAAMICRTALAQQGEGE